LQRSISERLVDGISSQDPTAIASCFADNVQFRALTPNGLRERVGSTETAALIAGWFGDSTELDLLDAGADEVSDRAHIWYRFAGVEDGEPYVVEQRLYCIASNGRIDRVDLVCSGFRPRPR
jgi:hypothetical protein